MDLDDDEYRATRKLHKVDKEDRINIDDGIKFIKYYINEYIAVDDIGIEDDFKFQDIIEYLIKDYKKIKEENTIFMLERSPELKIHVEKNYIPIAKVKELINSIDYRDYSNLEKFYKKEILNELLDKLERVKKSNFDANLEQLFKNLITRYDKSNSINVAYDSNGQAIIYTKVMLTDKENEFMKDYLKGDL